MENKKLLQVRELRGGYFAFKYPDGSSCFNDAYGVAGVNLESKLITDLIRFSGQILLHYMRGNFVMTNTNIIHYSSIDRDTLLDDDIVKKRILNHFQIGTKESYNHFGRNIYIMSRFHFFSLPSDKERLMYLTECHHQSLLYYSNKFGVDNTTALDNALLQIREVDWYFPLNTKKGLNSKKTHKAWVQRLNGYEFTTFRLAIEDQLTQEKTYIDLFKKIPEVKILDGIDLLTNIVDNIPIPAFVIEKEKWNRNKFVIEWGKPDQIGYEVYEFDLGKMELKRTI